MRNQWGNDDHGPDGDPSWLGGKDRGGLGSTDSQGDRGTQGSGWSSDFGSDESAQSPDNNFSGNQGSANQQQYLAPEFGKTSGPADADHKDPAHDGGSGWASQFTGQGRSGGRSRAGSKKALAPQLLGLLTSVIGLIIFAVIGYNMGMNLWWVIFVVGIPILSRGIRIVRRHLKS